MTTALKNKYNMKQFLFLIWVLIIGYADVQAQSDHAYGFLGGLTVGMQTWNGQDRDPLIAWNGRAFYEVLSDTENSLFGELGYHVKGSAIRSRFITQSGELFNNVNNMKVNNISLLLGGKRQYNLFKSSNDNFSSYLKLGLRLEYTASDTFDILQNFTEGINRVNYGATIGAGIHIGPALGPVQFVLDLQLSPDFSQQIYIPPGQYYNRFTQTFQPFAEQKVINIAIELTLGIRFVNRYYDE